MTSAAEGSFTAIRCRHILLVTLRRARLLRPTRGPAAILLLVLVALLGGCTRPLLERAIDARGGPLTSLSRDVEADVKVGFPGTWRWRFDYRVPDRLRWTLETYGEEQSYAFDGATARYFLGSARIGADPRVGDFRSQVRWMSVTTLDALVGSDAITLRELAADELPAGSAAGLDVTYRDDGSRYALYFDPGDRLIAAAGPIVIPTIAAGRMHAAFADFRDTSGFSLPYRGTYTLNDQPLFEERVLRYVPDDPRLERDDFRGPPPRAAR